METGRTSCGHSINPRGLKNYSARLTQSPQVNRDGRCRRAAYMFTGPLWHMWKPHPNMWNCRVIMKDVAVSSIYDELWTRGCKSWCICMGINCPLERDDSDVATIVIYMWCCFIFKLVFDSICNSEMDNGLLQSLMWNVELASCCRHQIRYTWSHSVTLVVDIYIYIWMAFNLPLCVQWGYWTCSYFLTSWSKHRLLSWE